MFAFGVTFFNRTWLGSWKEFSKAVSWMSTNSVNETFSWPTFFFLIFFMSKLSQLYASLLKRYFTLCCFPVFLSNRITIKYLTWGKICLKLYYLYMTVFQSIDNCPNIVFKKYIITLFIFLIQEIVLHLYLNSCCFLLLVQKLSESIVKVPCKIEIERF